MPAQVEGVRVKAKRLVARRIEETFQLAKGFTGLDQGQVTCWNSRMRWSLFSQTAAAVLARTATAVHDTAEDKPSPPPATSNNTTVTTNRVQELQLP